MDITHARPMALPSDFNSAVDIIIPYHGQYQKVARLLDSISKLIRSNFYRVCVVDDCSPNCHFFREINDNARKIARSQHKDSVIQAIRLEEQKGFAGALKAGFEATNNPYVCFVNSDCVVEDSNWLRSMGESLLSLKSEGVRMVAPMTNNAVGGDSAQEGDKNNREFPVILNADSHLSLYCFMCHRDLFAHCGGFLKEYPYGYYEDEEFAHRMRIRGFKQAVCRNSWIYHEGEMTIVDLWRRDPTIRKVMQKDNRERCIQDMRS